MRFVRTLLAGLLSGLALQAAIARVDFKSASGASPVTTATLDSTGASLLIVIVVDNGSSIPTSTTISDSKGNTWHARTSYGGAAYITTIFYAYDHGGSALSVGSGHTATATYGGGNLAFTFAAYSGTLASGDPYETNNGADVGWGGTGQPGGITPSVNGSLLVYGVNFPWPNQALVVSSVTDSFAIVNHVGMADFNAAYLDLVQTTAAAINPTATYSGNSAASHTIASFKPAATVTVRGNALVF